MLFLNRPAWIFGSGQGRFWQLLAVLKGVPAMPTPPPPDEAPRLTPTNVSRTRSATWQNGSSVLL